jgi:hypothetical protein
VFELYALISTMVVEIPLFWHELPDAGGATIWREEAQK